MHMHTIRQALRSRPYFVGLVAVGGVGVCVVVVVVGVGVLAVAVVPVASSI